eukprot:Sspe_Gene.84389::Locus_55401_Transcript_1_1_Confidence_1.000_Length_973::g.84389::m.84389
MAAGTLIHLRSPAGAQTEFNVTGRNSLSSITVVSPAPVTADGYTMADELSHVCGLQQSAKREAMRTFAEVTKERVRQARMKERMRQDAREVKERHTKQKRVQEMKKCLSKYLSPSKSKHDPVIHTTPSPLNVVYRPDVLVHSTAPARMAQACKQADAATARMWAMLQWNPFDLSDSVSEDAFDTFETPQTALLPKEFRAVPQTHPPSATPPPQPLPSSPQSPSHVPPAEDCTGESVLPINTSGCNEKHRAGTTPRRVEAKRFEQALRKQLVDRIASTKPLLAVCACPLPPGSLLWNCDDHCENCPLIDP